MGDLSWRFDKKEKEYINEVIDSGFASGTSGNMNTRLEQSFAKEMNQNFAWEPCQEFQGSQTLSFQVFSQF